MKASSQLKNYMLAWQNCLHSMKNGKIFLLFITYAIVQIGFLFGLVYFYAYPPFSSFLVPIVKKFFGDFALHYPNNYVILPTLFSWANLILGGLMGIVLVGTATFLFSMSYQNKNVKLKTGFKRTISYYFVLLAVWFVEIVALLAVFIGGPALLNKMEYFAVKGTIVVQLITAFGAIVVGALFIYTTALVILDKRGILNAISHSLKLFFKYPFTSLMLIGIPNLIKMPMDLLSGKTGFLITQFTPEIVGGVIILSILISMFANYFLVGTVTRYFLLVKEGG